MATSRAPIRKVRVGGISGAVATVVVWALDSIPGLTVPPPVAAAVTLLVTAGVAYWVPSAPGEASPPSEPPTLSDQPGAGADA